MARNPEIINTPQRIDRLMGLHKDPKEISRQSSRMQRVVVDAEGNPIITKELVVTRASIHETV